MSIQGESVLSGMPALFIRLSGCNLRCAYCDTAYAFARGRRMGLREILDHVPPGDWFHVAITGGEPLAQKGTVSLVSAIRDLGHDVVVFTNGTLPIRDLPPGTTRVIDIKTPWAESMPPDHYPGYLQSPYLLLDNLTSLTPLDQVKFVIRNRTEFLWAVDFLKHNTVDLPAENRIFTPEARSMDPGLLARWILDAGIKVRVGLQIHRFLNTDPEPPS